MSDIQVTNYGICGECKYNTVATDHTDNNKVIGFYCSNGNSEHYWMWTDYTDTCEYFEQRGVE